MKSKKAMPKGMHKMNGHMMSDKMMGGKPKKKGKK